MEEIHRNKEGQLHREDGPARITVCGLQEWGGLMVKSIEMMAGKTGTLMVTFIGKAGQHVYIVFFIPENANNIFFYWPAQ